MSSLGMSFKSAENSLAEALEAKRSAIDDATGKGAATEAIVQDCLLRPHLAPQLRCGKGAVLSASDPSNQSPAIDRVIYDPSAASPILYDETHSIFPIEAVCGLVEITIRLDAGKLREDISRMTPVKAMRTRRYLEPIAGTKTRAQRVQRESLSPRSYVVGLPADPNWDPKTIAKTLRTIQVDLGSPTHVHGLYVIGRGYFETIAVESDSEPLFRIRGWLGDDRLFRFTTSFRQSFDRWPKLQPGISVDLQDYVPGSSAVLAE
jgi:hypothetical protein